MQSYLSDRRVAAWATDASTEAVPTATDRTPIEGASAKPSAPKPGFVNRQKFQVPDQIKSAFVEAWNARSQLMEQAAGFTGFDIQKQGDETYVVESRWASIPEWEEFNLSSPARRHHLPWVCPFLP
jgi:heme-degrading monooxygenase HmoA